MISVRSNWPGLRRVDAEVGGQLHRAAHALRHVDERAVGEHRRVERREEVVGVGHDGAEVLLDQLRMVLHRFGEGAEDHAGRRQALLERGGDRDAVEHGIDRHAGEPRALVQRHAELLVGREQLRVDLVEALRPVRLGLRRGVVGDRPVVDRLEAARAPSAARASCSQWRNAFRRHSSQELRLAFLREMSAHDVLVEAGRHACRTRCR